MESNMVSSLNKCGMAKVLMANGDVVPALKRGDKFLLEELQEYVGGFIELVPLDGHIMMVVNEEGKLLRMPDNAMATDINRLFRKSPDVLVGDVVLCYTDEVD